MTLRQIQEHHHTKWREWLSLAARWLTVVLLLLLYLHAHGWAQGIKPTGTNTQHVICDSGCAAGATQAVTGTFWQATQPVSGTFWQATQPVSGTFWQATQPVSIASMPSTPVTGTFWQATQPVSGTVTANQGT